jgi:hypothetical protein
VFSRGQCGLEVNESDSDFFLSFSTGMPPEIQKLHFTALKEEVGYSNYWLLLLWLCCIFQNVYYNLFICFVYLLG